MDLAGKTFLFSFPEFQFSPDVLITSHLASLADSLLRPNRIHSTDGGNTPT